MSEPAPEIPRPRAPKPPSAKSGGLGKKVGPLPVWAWGAIIVGTIGFVLFVRSRSKGGSTSAPTDSSGITDFGGGPPAPPANGVVPPGFNWTDPCPPGFTLQGGACVPVDAPGSGGGGPIAGGPIYQIPWTPDDTPRTLPPPEILGKTGISGASHALHHNLSTSAASTKHAPVKRRKHPAVGR